MDCNQKIIKMLNKMRRPDSRQAEKPSGQCHFILSNLFPAVNAQNRTNLKKACLTPMARQDLFYAYDLRLLDCPLRHLILNSNYGVTIGLPSESSSGVNPDALPFL